jgi:3D (Asp-Asp-Asp) domain-containing protein
MAGQLETRVITFNEPKALTWEVYEVSSYTSGAESTGKTPSHPAYGITASGARVKEGVTIACPPELPFGTIIEINGVGKRICEDRGSAIKGRKLDLYITSLSEALRFGRQHLKIRIVEAE